ncbi:hypothetical protein [Streptomyces sp. UNOB3_S3]|uniref:hypothetical protein n=1 Tax=Streptomyces sp. UNOB3_S3 TaxID=2871682 RepID=UPI001E36EF44|nr:hypothetical protein [Streptomyces sp. UNOB3_S3]MCC3779293.1 hypothetical protein [Streptomyces sp. UNOB3_S3]
MRRILALGVLGTAVLCATASPAHAAGRPGDGPVPVAQLAAPAEATLCHGETKNLPVVSQYSGVVQSVCGALPR